MSDSQEEIEDGELSDSPKEEVVEVLDSGSFVLDFNDDALEILDDSQDGDTESNKSKEWMNAVLSPQTSHKEASERKEKRARNACFNCSGQHTLNQCPLPKDFKKIREMREQFMGQGNKDVRYTTDPNASGANQFKPGRISDGLQRALGIGPNDIPEYIYRMRRMGFERGYPPGYLKKAIVQQAEDTLNFHTDNHELQSKEEDKNKRPVSPTIDANKVVYYFGFNKTYRALRDRERFVVPPFEEFVSFLEKGVKGNFREEQSKKRAEERKEKRKSNGAETQGEVEKKKKKKKEETQEAEVVSLEDEEPSTSQSTNSPISTQESSIGTPTGSQRRVSMGTPVLEKRKVSEKLPSLDAFAQGVVPFQVEAPTPRTGFMNKIIKKIRKHLG